MSSKITDKKSKNKALAEQRRKNAKKKRVITAAVIVAAVAVCAIVAVLVYNLAKPVSSSELCGNAWIPGTATNSSGDEVEMSEIYGVNYSAYQCSLSFFEDGTFSFWLTPGDPEDGTHSGTYTVADEDTIDLVFDDGTNTSFEMTQKDGKVDSITVNYSDYTIVFVKQKNE